MTTIFVSSLWLVEEIIETEQPDWIIGILDPSAKAWKDRKFGDEKRLRLSFHDVHFPPVAEGTVPPNEDHVRQIVTFVRRQKGQTGLVHCHAGVSRSTAAALIAACALAPSGVRGYVYQMSLHLKSAYPNRWMVMMADELLGLQHNLISAVRTMPPAESQSVDRAFRLEI